MSLRVRSLAMWISLCVAVAALAIRGDAQGPPSGPEFVPNEVLVQFQAGASAAARVNARARVNGVRVDTVVTENGRADGRGDLELVRIPPGLAVAAAVRNLAGDEAVDFAEPNWVYQHAIASDTYFTNGSLWGMYGDSSLPANPYGSQAAEAWARGNVGSDNVYVGIIDEGVFFTHADLAGNMWLNPHDPADGIDNDGNGYVDDVRGWDFDGNNNSVFDGSQDEHATHVAGTIGAVTNGVGVVGVNWNVTMISGKFLGRNGGTTANAIKAVNYFTDLKVRHGMNIVATNNSWGGGGFSQSLLNAITAAGDQNILFIAAAGNGGRDGVGDNNDTTAFYPANYNCSCVISVAAITSSGAKAAFSNYGVNTVDIGAPGQGIVSTVPTKQGGSAYASFSGTSMATPHVTGAAALYAATHAGETAAQIKAAILSAALPTSSLAGRTVTGGRLNASGF